MYYQINLSLSQINYNKNMNLQYAKVNVQEVSVFTILSTVKADYNEIQEQRWYNQNFNPTLTILCSTNKLQGSMQRQKIIFELSQNR